VRIISVAKTSIGRQHQSQSRLFSRLGNPTQNNNNNNNNNNTMTTTTNTIRAKRITLADLTAAGIRLRNGDLVAFPTETVYGLGCNALDESAIAKVFAAKERPSSDPLIAHVLTTEQACRLWACGSSTSSGSGSGTADTSESDSTLEYRILSTLCDHFWPGPLTLVAAAAETVPPSLMAHTGYCAVRSPSHLTARALIAAADSPIAAPSANKFGHVSPTTAHHVWDDLSMEDVWILHDNDDNNGVSNGDTTTENRQQDSSTLSPSSCHVGVESTVAKLEMNMNSADGTGTSHGTNTLTVLRQGAISVRDLAACLLQAGLGPDQIQVSAVQRATADHVANVAPGQTIRHYSPRVPSFLVSAQLYSSSSNTTTTTDGIQQEQEPEQKPDTQQALQSTILIDFGQRLVHWKEHCLSYRDLSVTGDSAQACATVFEALRWTERVAGAERVLFPDFGTSDQSDALTMALKDRLTRAASGVVLEKLQ
jgi:L-threonylcarbamoyladenylate synthase